MVDRKDSDITRSIWLPLVPLSLAGMASAVPWLLVHFPMIGFAVQRGFLLVCHQRPERSFGLFGGTVAVCARCLGIYFGAAAGALMRVPREVAWQLFVAAVSINAIDWLTEFAGIHGNWMFSRFALGLTLGATAAMLLIASTNTVKTPTQAKAA